MLGVKLLILKCTFKKKYELLSQTKDITNTIMTTHIPLPSLYKLPVRDYACYGIVMSPMTVK